MNIVLIFLLICTISMNLAIQPKNKETFSVVSKPYIEEYGKPLSIEREYSQQLGYKIVYYYWEDRYVVFYFNRNKGSNWIVLKEGKSIGRRDDR